jgi:hypothetical protein
MFKKIVGTVSVGKDGIKINFPSLSLVADILFPSESLLRQSSGKKNGEKIEGYVFTGVEMQEIEMRSCNLVLAVYTREEIETAIKSL